MFGSFLFFSGSLADFVPYELVRRLSLDFPPPGIGFYFRMLGSVLKDRTRLRAAFNPYGLKPLKFEVRL